MHDVTLPPLPFAEWEPTKTTLHLWVQIVGKIRLHCVPFKNHWWHVPLYVDARGITTRRMEHDGVAFELRFDFREHRLYVICAGDAQFLELRDGYAVADFYRDLMKALGNIGVHVPIWTKPYGVPITTKFEDDREHASYDPSAVERWWRIVAWSGDVFEKYASDFTGKSSPVHLFWHSFDLAITRFSGRRAPENPSMGTVDREAYSHEVISCGFWAGDQNIAYPAYYTYTAPEPKDLTRQPLDEGGTWVEMRPGSHLGVLPYDFVRTSEHPESTLLGFLHRAYEMQSVAANWPKELMR